MSSLKVNCPQCQKSLIWDSTSPYRPFCSERCKLLDLGAWASDKHAIAGEQVDDDLLAFADDDNVNHVL